jgi:hypothetical protein
VREWEGNDVKRKMRWILRGMRIMRIMRIIMLTMMLIMLTMMLTMLTMRIMIPHPVINTPHILTS